MLKTILVCLAAAGLAAAARQAPAPAPPAAMTPVSIERLDPALDRLIAPDAKIEVLAEGHDWTEGPLWIRTGRYLLFSDIPKNSIYRWKEGEGERLYLQPSGYTGQEPRGGETGSNGLILDREGRLVLCQHGDRRMARMDAPLEKPAPNFVTLAARYQGKRFNSPNDAVYRSNGDLYFTDPAYGMEKQWEDPKRELPFAGVYRRRPSGEVMLMTSDMTRPNGLAFSPDERRLYISDTHRSGSAAGPPHMRVFAVAEDGTLAGGEVFAVPTSGAFDGFRLDDAGRIWTSAGDGVHCYDPDGTLLGKVLVPEPVANVVFGGPKRNRLFICGTTSLYSVMLAVNGDKTF